MNITQLEPSAVWKHFARICAIPHPSGHEQQLRQYLLDFADALRLPSAVDGVGNVLIRKPASPGLNEAPVVILQCHLDMVPQKNNATVFDFLRDPIRPYIDGDWVAARDTTLGADNGIGVAVALTALENTTMRHGQLHALFTIEEETGLKGAMHAEPAFLNGRYLINLDTEEEGVACIGCAGGARTDFVFNADWDECPVDYCGIKLALSGLKGGHSGMDINRGRGNALLIMAEFLAAAQERLGLRLIHWNGGGLDNAIPRETVAAAAVAVDREMELSELLNDFQQRYRHQLRQTDPEIQMFIHRADSPLRVLSLELQQTILRAARECPNGALAFSSAIPDLVETSSNLASVTTSDDQIKFTTSQRSSCDRKREALIVRMENLFRQAGADCVRRNSYPGWPPEPASQLAECCKTVFSRLFRRELEFAAIHAGLECGIFKGKNAALEMISIGPDILGAHSPDERVRIESVKNFQLFLEHLLLKLALG